jgi:ribosomal protein S18 acetylase RimI-like enzyme
MEPPEPFELRAACKADAINISLFHEQSVILVLCLGQSGIVACVHVQGDQSGAYIGMLATDPKVQAKGLGKRMLFHPETYAIEHFKASVLKMSVSHWSQASTFCH